MLTTDRPRVDAAVGLAVRIEVSSVLVRLALSYVTEEQGWRLDHDEGDRGRCLVVTDRVPDAGRFVDVLVARDTPSDCQVALDAVLAGTARAILLWDEPNALPGVIAALERAEAIIPERVIQLAQHAPRLSARARRTLQLVGAGRSNAEISFALHQSHSTTKREIAELMAVFDAANRAGLIAAAGRLGFV